MVGKLLVRMWEIVSLIVSIFQYPMEIFKEAWRLGLVNMHVPEAYGNCSSCLSWLSLYLDLWLR